MKNIKNTAPIFKDMDIISTYRSSCGDTKLGANHELLATMDLDGLPNKLFICKQTPIFTNGLVKVTKDSVYILQWIYMTILNRYLIDPGGVEEVDTQVECLSDGSQRLLFLSIAIKVTVKSSHALFRRFGISRGTLGSQ